MDSGEVVGTGITDGATVGEGIGVTAADKDDAVITIPNDANPISIYFLFIKMEKLNKQFLLRKNYSSRRGYIENSNRQYLSPFLSRHAISPVLKRKISVSAGTPRSRLAREGRKGRCPTSITSSSRSIISPLIGPTGSRGANPGFCNNRVVPTAVAIISAVSRTRVFSLCHISGIYNSFCYRNRLLVAISSRP